MMSSTAKPVSPGFMRALLLAVTPLGLILTAACGLIIEQSMAWPLHLRELAAALLISLLGGLLAITPLVLMLNRGVIWVARMFLVGILVRMSVTLGGLLLALGPGWKLERKALAIWVLACYLVLLVLETATTAWVMRRQAAE